MTSAEFFEFLQLLRQRDPQAREQLVALYQDNLEAYVRRFLVGSPLRSLLDPADISQEVLIQFLEGAVHRTCFESPAKLGAYLGTMAMNLLINAARRERRHQPQDPGAQPVFDPGSSPSQHVAREELMDEFLARLSAEALAIYPMHAAGYSWQEIGAALGIAPHAIRARQVRYLREINRVAREIGVMKEDSSDGN